MKIITHDEIKSISEYFSDRYNLAQQFNELLERATEDDNINRTYHFNAYSHIRSSYNDPVLKVKTSFIRAILKCDKLKKLLTTKEYDNINKNIETLANNKNFIISEASAHDIIASFFNNATDIIKKQLKDCYLILTNNRNFAYNENSQNSRFKNQETFKVGVKVKICSTTRSSLEDLIKCFNLITAKNHVSNLPHVGSDYYAYASKHYDIDYAKKYDYHYFNIKFFKNGNSHLEFIDLEALEAFNLNVGKYFNYIKA